MKNYLEPKLCIINIELESIMNASLTQGNSYAGDVYEDWTNFWN